MTNDIKSFAEKAKEEIRKVIVGQDKAIDTLIAALICRGHVLLEGVPGTAKTLLVKVLAYIMDCDFKRIQFTPDLMPSDVLGTTVYEESSKSFILKKGPIFTNLLLADEINRTPPKTQAALLEAMEEQQVTIDGNGNVLASPFMVFATQNPVEYEGTYPLPEAQLDRFLFKIIIKYPETAEEKEILLKHHKGFDPHDLSIAKLSKVIKQKNILSLQDSLKSVTVEDKILDYIVNILQKTRDHSDISLGASPRAGVMLLNATKCFAAMNGRDFVIPDDVKWSAPLVLRHRLLIKPDAEIEGISQEITINEILNSVEVPR